MSTTSLGQRAVLAVILLLAMPALPAAALGGAATDPTGASSHYAAPGAPGATSANLVVGFTPAPDTTLPPAPLTYDRIVVQFPAALVPATSGIEGMIQSVSICASAAEAADALPVAGCVPLQFGSDCSTTTGTTYCPTFDDATRTITINLGTGGKWPGAARIGVHIAPQNALGNVGGTLVHLATSEWRTPDVEAVYKTMAGALSCFDVSAPATVTASVPVNVVVTAKAGAFVKADYDQGVAITTTDAKVPPQAHLYASSDAGRTTFVMTFHTAGTQTLATQPAAACAPVSVSVAPGPLDHIEVSDANGAPVQGKTVAAGDTLRLQVVARDADDNALATAPSASWSLTTGAGTLAPSSGPGTTFTASTAGVAVVAAAVGARSATTGPIAVTTGALASVSIQPFPGGLGTPVGDSTLAAETGSATPLFAAGYDAGHNYIGDTSVAWSVVGGCGTVTPASGAATTFQPTTPTSGPCFVHAEPAAPASGDDTGSLRVTHGRAMQLAIRMGSATGPIADAPTLATGESLPLYARLLDEFKNDAGAPSQASWTVLHPCADLSATTGAQVILVGRNVTTASADCRVRVATQDADYPSPSATGAQSVGTQLAYSGAVTVTPGAAQSLLLRTQPHGGGAALRALTLSADDTLQVWAAGYDAAGNFVADQPLAAWTVDVGQLSQATGATTTYSPGAAGPATLAAAVGSMRAQIAVTITPGALAALRVVDHAAPATELGAFTLASGTSKSLDAQGFDAHANPLGLVSASWSLAGTCGAIATTTGASTVFTAGYRQGADACRVTAASDGISDSTGDITLTIPAADAIVIRDAPDGGGAAVGDLSTSADDNHTFYAAAYAGGHYLSDAPASWSIASPSSPGVGSLSSANGPTTMLNPAKVGTLRVSATAGSLAAQTGVVSVFAGKLAVLSIEDSAGAPVATRSLAPSDSLSMRAIGRDADGNFVQAISAAWSATGTGGVVTPPAGTTATFTALRPGTEQVNARDADGNTAAATLVVHGLVHHIQVELQDGGTTQPAPGAPLHAGDAVTLFAEGYDAQNNYAGPVVATWSVTGGIGAASPASGPSTTFAARKTGVGHVTATDTDGHVASTGDYTVSANAKLDHFAFVAFPATAPACVAIPVVVQARDAFDNLKRDFAGPVAFATTDANATLPGPATNGVDAFAPADAGSKAYSLAFAIAGPQSWTVSSGPVSGSTGAVAVVPGALHHFEVPTIGAQVARVPFPLVAYAKDACNNTITGFGGPTTLAADAGTVSPASLSFDGGKTSPSAFLTRSGPRVLTISSGAVSSTGPVAVSANPAAAAIKIVDGPSATAVPVATRSVTPDATSSFWAAKYDQDDNWIGAATATWTLTPTTPGVTLGALSTSSGSTTTLTPDVAGAGTLTADDGATHTASVAITNSPGIFDHLAVFGAPASATSDVPFGMTVKAMDKASHPNVIPTFAGAVTLTSDDTASASLGSHAYVGGDAGAFTFTGLVLKTARSTVITAASGGKSVTTALVVAPGPAAKLATVCAACAPIAGNAQTITVKALDAEGNVATAYVGAHALTFSGPHASPSGASFACAPATFASGAASVSCTFAKAEALTLTVTDATLPAGAGATFTVGPAPAAKLLATLPGQSFDPATVANTGAVATQTAGASFAATLRAIDAFGNAATGYAGQKDVLFAGTAGYDGTAPTARNNVGNGVDVPFGQATNLTFAGGAATTTLFLYRAVPQTVTVSATTLTGASSASIPVVASATAAQLGIMYADGVQCTPAKLNALDRACLRASESVDGMQNPIQVRSDADITLYSVKLDDWDNVIGLQRTNWKSDGTGSAGSGGYSIGNQDHVTWSWPDASQETISVSFVGTTALRPAQMKLDASSTS